MDRGQIAQYLILGGAGYFGARLAEHLSEEARVVVTSRSLGLGRSRWLASKGNRIEWRQYDSSRTAQLPIEETFTCIVNLATPSAAEAARSPDDGRARAESTARACIEALRQGRAERLVHASTFHVYGSVPRDEYADDAAPGPTHPYGHAHAACEALLKAEAAELPVAIVRPTNIVGAPAHGDLGPQWSLVFLDLCRQAVERRSIALTTDGNGFRDFVMMSDAIDAVRTLIECARPAPPAMSFNLASGLSTRLAEVARLVQRVAAARLDTDVALTLGSVHDAFDRTFVVSNAGLRALGWRPDGDIVAEIERTLEFLLRSELRA